MSLHCIIRSSKLYFRNYLIVLHLINIDISFYENYFNFDNLELYLLLHLFFYKILNSIFIEIRRLILNNENLLNAPNLVYSIL